MKRIDYILIVAILLIIISGFIGIKMFDKDEPFDIVNQSSDNLTVRQSDNLTVRQSDSPTLAWNETFGYKMSQYNNSQNILNLINSEFEIIEGNNTILSAEEVYNARSGTEYDLMRLVFNILLNNNLQGAILVYEYGGQYDMVVNFRDIDEPRYVYIEDGIFKMQHHGWSFEDLMDKEEERQNIKIDKYGYYFEGDLLSDKIMDLTNVTEWIVRGA